MTYISSQSVLSSVRQSVLQAQAGLAQAQTEISTGTRSDLGVALGARTGYSLSLKNEVDALDGRTASNAVASARLDATATTLTSLLSTAQALSNTLITASSAGGTTAGLQAGGTSALQALLGGLNTSVAGRYVFGGINSGVQPLGDYFSATSSTAKQSIDTAFSQTFGVSQTSDSASTISGSALRSFLDGAMDAQFSDANWSANWSKASGTAITSQISPSQSATTSVSANDTAFRRIAEAYTILSEFTGSNFNADAKAAAVAKASSLMSSGIAALSQVQTGVGVSQAAIDTANTGLAARSSVLKGEVSNLESVDTYALSNRVTTLQTKLQASYELTSRLQSLSLVNYING